MRKEDGAPSLQEFGLSRYEAKAYLALLRRGPLSVSELAYHASIPRTKAYGTLNKLARKGLATITHDKPVVYGAASPREAFGELLVEQESKIRGMKSTVETLNRMGSEARRPKRAQEQTYIILDPDSVLRVLQELISTARSTVVLVLDSWGARLVSQCTNPLKKALAKNVVIKLLVSRERTVDLLRSLPEGVDVRKGEGGMNLFVFDRATIMMVNASDGRGVLFQSTDVMASIFNELIYNMWSGGTDIVCKESKETGIPNKEAKLVKLVAKDPVASL